MRVCNFLTYQCQWKWRSRTVEVHITMFKSWWNNNTHVCSFFSVTISLLSITSLFLQLENVM